MWTRFFHLKGGEASNWIFFCIAFWNKMALNDAQWSLPKWSKVVGRFLHHGQKTFVDPVDTLRNIFSNIFFSMIGILAPTILFMQKVAHLFCFDYFEVSSYPQLTSVFENHPFSGANLLFVSGNVSHVSYFPSNWWTSWRIIPCSKWFIITMGPSFSFPPCPGLCLTHSRYPRSMVSNDHRGMVLITLWRSIHGRRWGFSDLAQLGCFPMGSDVRVF